MKKINKKGFTLIELLVVIAIIGILSTMAVIALGSARKKARDGKRQSDLKILQTAVEMYIADNDAVPVPTIAANDGWDGAANSLAVLLNDYLTGGMPVDPSGTARDWIYCFNNTNGTYMVATSLEQNKDVNADLDSVSNWTAGECCASDDGHAAGNAPDCSDSNNGTIDDDANVTAVCLGSDDAT